MTNPEISSVLKEKRVFPPPAEFAAAAHVGSMERYRELYRRSIDDPEGFFGDVARELHWHAPWNKVLDWQLPFAKWFVGGKTNLAFNCLDRHLGTWRKNKAAIIWEGEPGEVRTLTYLQLHAEVCKFANALSALGLKTGDTVAIYMPMVPELPIALLACARLGVGHSVVFGGFSAEALRERINDCEAKAVITADGGFRKGSTFALKASVDDAIKDCPSIRHCVVLKRTGQDVAWSAGRDHWWHDLTAKQSARHEAPALDAETLLFILYTSGTTGKPKGIVHTTGGYMVGTYLSAKLVFDLKDDDVYWCTADVGWVTGHSYIVYGPLLNGATVVMYEGAPNVPHPGRFWEIVERHRVTVFYTAPTALRTFVRWGDEHPNRFDLSSLRLLGTVGEPINPEAWMWYHRVIGKERCPIVDTWWQTETGSIMITPLPGATPTKPGSGTLPFFGVEPDVVDATGKSVKPNEGGFLVLKRPWPSMLRTIYKNPERFKEGYWKRFPGFYFAGDGARRDEDGYFWIMGRVDDVINVSGHRLSTMEVESALVSHRKVAEAAVVARPDDVKGQAIVAFVTPKQGMQADDDLRTELRGHVVKEIGALARPDDIRFTDALPKTRSGKIMRRLLRDIAAGQAISGDTSTLEDYSILARLRTDDDE
ncbi:MAG: acetate--CoA ligase [Planctomycetes bacterium]|nr:acetate--CoA ligase [Planctomycetota bacterium]